MKDYRALEADFRRYYQIDLSGLYAGSLSVLHVAGLAAHLPLGAQVYQGTDASWTIEAHLLAVLADLWADKPIDRPSDVADKQARLDARRAKAMLHASRNVEGG